RTCRVPATPPPATPGAPRACPVPYRAEWVGVPPRLLISRLVFAGRTVGVLLGTLITREPFGAQTREAIDLSCELIASAMAMYSAAALAAPGSELPAAAMPQP